MQKLLLIIISCLLLLSFIQVHDSSVKLETNVKPQQEFENEEKVYTYYYQLDIDTTEDRELESSGDISHYKISAKSEILTKRQQTFNEVWIHYHELVIDYNGTRDGDTTAGKNEEDVEIMYVANLHLVTNQILKLSRPANPNLNMELMDWYTTNLIKQKYPDRRKRSDSPYYTSENFEIEDHMGIVVPNYEETKQGDDLILRKFYDNDDFKEYFYDLHGSMPDIDYDEVTTIDTNGYIKESHLSYNFELKKDLTKQPDDILGNYELLGEVTADIDANLLLQDVVVDKDSEKFKELYYYYYTTQFVAVDLENDGGKVEINDEVKDIAQYDYPTGPIYEQKYVIFEKTILKQTFGIDLFYKNFGRESTVDGVVVVNNRVILKILSIKYQHCPFKDRQKDWGKDLNIQLFSVSWPVLAVLTIHLRASLNLKFGYTWFFGGSDEKTGCELRFQPYFHAGIMAQGGASVLHIVEGGMYASGYVANSYLTFKALAKVAKTSKEDKLGISVTLDVNLNPFEYDIGAYYRFIKCDFRKIFKFKWRKICSWGTMHKKPLVQGKFGQTIHKTIFKWEKLI